MPAKWKTTFQNANKTINDTMLNGMCAYFNRQNTKDLYTSTSNPYQDTDSCDSDNASDNSDNIDNQDLNVDNQDEVNNQDSADNQGNLGTQGASRPTFLLNTDTCPSPNHQGCTWGRGYHNKYTRIL